MPKHGKKYREVKEKMNPADKYSLDDALRFVKENAKAEFDETVEVSMKLGVNPKHADQQVRGTVVLPHGTGKSVRILVMTQGEKEMEAKDAGADYVGCDEYVEKINNNWLEFDAVIATPDVMSKVGRLGRILGPRGLMPNPKAGTVTFDVARAVREIKAGKIEYRVDRGGNIHAPIGKVSFDLYKLKQNATALFEVIMKAKPSSAKGAYLRNVVLTSTMGPGVKLDTVQIVNIFRK